MTNETKNNTNIDPTTGEPQDNKPLYYRSKANQIMLDDGSNLQDNIDELKSHTHNLADLNPDEDHQFISKEEKEKYSTYALYSNPNPTYTKHGGIEIGSTFENKTVKEMLDMILYPYEQPVLTMTVNCDGFYAEIGSTKRIQTVTLRISSKSNDVTKIQIMNRSEQWSTTNVSLRGDHVHTTNLFRNITESASIFCKVTDDSGSITTSNAQAITFVYPIYYGALNGDDTPTASQIKALTKHIGPKALKTFSFNCTEECMLFAYPVSYGKLTKILDPNNFDMIGAFTVDTIYIPCLDGQNVQYYVYTNNRSTVSNFTMKFQW